MIIVPIKSKSERLPDKHIRRVGGFYVFEYTMRYLQFFKHTADVIVVSDDAFILAQWENANFAVVHKGDCNTAPFYDALRYGYDRHGSNGEVHYCSAVAPYKPANLFTRLSMKRGNATACVPVRPLVHNPMCPFTFINDGNKLIPPHGCDYQTTDTWVQCTWTGLSFHERLFALADNESWDNSCWTPEGFWKRCHDNTVGLLTPDEPWIDIDTQRDLDLFEDQIARYGLPYWM